MSHERGCISKLDVCTSADNICDDCLREDNVSPQRVCPARK